MGFLYDLRGVTEEKGDIMEGEQKRVFLVLADDEIAGIRPPKGIYFTKFLSAAQEMWI